MKLHLSGKKDLPPCTETYRRTHGLPCSRIILSLLQHDKLLSLNQFHAHWHLRDELDLQRCHEPGTFSRRSIPTGNLHPLAIPPQSNSLLGRFIEGFNEGFIERFNGCFTEHFIESFNKPFQASHPRSNTNGPVQRSLQ